MSDSTFDSIFDELIDESDDLRTFITILEELLPGVSVHALPGNGPLLAGSRTPLPPDPVIRALAATARQEGQAAGPATDEGAFCHAFSLDRFNAVLFLCLPDGQSDTRETTLLKNSIELALLRQEQEALVAEKDQALRQISILKQQHSALIEDNYRQYRLNQDREKQYARELESEITRQTAELREANARLEEISRMKSDFLANMSHELRTPMNAIIGFGGLLIESGLSGEQAEYARTIVSSATGLLGLINDILDLAKVESGKMALEQTPFDLPELVATAIAMFSIPAKNKGVEVASRLDPRIPKRIIGDSLRLRQVLVNLIGNAMKFTERGRIDLLVDFEREEAGRIVARFAVRDTGIGIPADRLGAIFEKFTQVDGSTTRKYGGTGLGLAISTQIVALMGGNLSVESELGRGSTFFFTISLEAAPEEAGQAKEAVVAQTPEAKKRGGRVLLVEDNVVNQRLASILIKKEGFEVDVASDGLEALARLKAERYDLVFMDVQMPNMDGMTATRKIREIEADGASRQAYLSLDQRSDPIPVIGLTAHAGKEDEDACYRAGMNAFLTKPIIKAKLIAVLDRVLPGSP